jgi:hypothetical protein
MEKGFLKFCFLVVLMGLFRSLEAYSISTDLVQKIEPFDLKKYTQIEKNPFFVSCQNDLEGVYYPPTLFFSGMQLVQKYYERQAGVNIIFIGAGLDSESAFLTFKMYLESIRFENKDKANYRCAFIWGATASHTIPIIYIKENYEEALLYANSIADSERDWLWDNFIKAIGTQGISIYRIDATRQASPCGCKIDALSWAKEATGKRKNGTYFISNLLSFLKTYSEKETLIVNVNLNEQLSHFRVKKLPANLLKTAQISKFVKIYANEVDQIIHKAHLLKKLETIAEYRKKFQDHVQRLRQEKPKIGQEGKAVSSYLRKKGLHFVRVIIPLQFYLDQIKNILGDRFTQEIENAWIQRAKVILKNGQHSQAESDKALKKLHDSVESFLLLFP